MWSLQGFAHVCKKCKNIYKHIQNATGRWHRAHLQISTCDILVNCMLNQFLKLFFNTYSRLINQCKQGHIWSAICKEKRKKKLIETKMSLFFFYKSPHIAFQAQLDKLIILQYLCILYTCLLNPCLSSITKVLYKLHGSPVIVLNITDPTINTIDCTIW